MRALSYSVRSAWQVPLVLGALFRHVSSDRVDTTDASRPAVVNIEIAGALRQVLRQADADSTSVFFSSETHVMNNAPSIACCCMTKKAEKCAYFPTVLPNTNYDSCCKVKPAKDGCTFLSHYWTQNDVWTCVGPNVRGDDKIRAHDNYEPLLPDSASNPTPASYLVEIKPLGEGGFGTVYLARHRVSGQVVAIKVNNFKKKGNSERTEKDCESMKAVHHRVLAGQKANQANGMRHLLQCLEADSAYLVTEYAGGAPYEFLASSSPNSTLRLLKQVFMGLDALANSNPPTVHHDLKWHNVVVDKTTGCLKIIDLDGAFEATSRAVFWTAPRSPYTAKYGNTSEVFCGSVVSEDACSAAYSYDAYTAGVMVAAALCGAAEWAFYMSSVASFDVIKEMLVKQKAKQNSLSELAMVYKVGVGLAVDNFAGPLAWKKLSLQDQIRYLRANRLPERPTEARAEVFPGSSVYEHLAEAFSEKLAFCESLLEEDAESLDILEKLRRDFAHAGERPKPEQVLASNLFNNLPTGCSGDGAEG